MHLPSTEARLASFFATKDSRRAVFESDFDTAHARLVSEGNEAAHAAWDIR